MSLQSLRGLPLNGRTNGAMGRPTEREEERVGTKEGKATGLGRAKGGSAGAAAAACPTLATSSPYAEMEGERENGGWKLEWELGILEEPCSLNTSGIGINIYISR